MKKLALILLILSPFTAVFAQKKIKQIVWKIDNLEKIGGNKIEILGEPKVIKTERGKAVEFDGVDDGIFINVNPLEGAGEFTIEAVFRPDANGAKEQLWFHIEDTENVESRALLETRVTGNEWFLDTFIKSGENRLPLYAENFKHKTGEWHTVTLVFDGKEMRHYVNGKLELSGNLQIKPFGKGRTSIGVRQNKVFWFKGAVRKIRFTNAAIPINKFLKN